MTSLQAEIDSNSKTFAESWISQLESNIKSLRPEPTFTESYRRISGLNSLKSSLVGPFFSKGSAAFYFEAHNDALVSHVSASFGSWRSALQALRSALENALCSLYYKDHPVELARWDAETFRIGFSEMVAYFERHPLIEDVERSIGGLQIVRKEYATLSKAVHGSAVDFRMTAGENVLLWSPDKIRAKRWADRERRTIEGVALLFVCIFREHLTGAKLTPLRDMLAFMVHATRRKAVKEVLKVSIPDLGIH